MMKTLILVLLVALNFSCWQPVDTSVTTESWNKNKRKQLLANRNDTTTWDMEMLENDKQIIGIGDLGPFEVGVFPTPKYDLVGEGSFKGIGNYSETFQLNDRTIEMNSFFVNDNELNKAKLKGFKNEMYFQLLVATDTLDTLNYKLNRSIGISRNHPDYIGQGFVQTKNSRIDYVCFQTAENSGYAIVNMRLFHLQFGKTILVSPQQDGTLRTLQLESPALSSDSLLHYTTNLLQKEQVKTFFEQPNSIQ